MKLGPGTLGNRICQFAAGGCKDKSDVDWDRNSIGGMNQRSLSCLRAGSSVEVEELEILHV